MKRAGSHIQKLFFPLLFILGAPVSGMADFTHVVERGESLYSLSKKYHVEIREIQERNGLKDSKIRAGQSLAIPEKGRKAESAPLHRREDRQKAGEDEFPDWDLPETHVVKKGETLGKIAQRYHLSVEDLEAVNALKDKRLKPGQTLYLQVPPESGQEEEAGIGGENQENQREASAKVPSGFPSENDRLSQERDRQLLAKVAKAFLGLKYRRGGTNINGMDCSGFVQKIFKIFDVDLPRTTREQFRVGTAVAREALAIGDLVFFKRGKARRPGHVGIYIGNGEFIHTSLRKERVEVDSLEKRYFEARFIGGKRIGLSPTRLEMAEPDK